ncbi:IAA-alanine resistance protein 1 [Linum perenne]
MRRNFMSQLMLLTVAVVASGFLVDLCSGDGLCTSPVHDHSGGHHHHHHDSQCSGHHHHHHHDKETEYRLPEELAEEEDMKLYGFGNYHDHQHEHDHDHHHHVDSNSKLFGLSLWLHAMGCSLLVSLASLICLIILPIIFVQGKPSKGVVDSLALFGAGAMLGDAFLHQLPHAFGGQHSHSHDDLSHDHSGHEHVQAHSHSLEDLSVGLSVLAGIVVFLLVEKAVRYVEDNSSGAGVWGHAHHHHHNSYKKLKDDDNGHEQTASTISHGTEEASDGSSDSMSNGNKSSQQETHIRRRKGKVDESDVAAADSSNSMKLLEEKDVAKSPSNLVFGYLNLFSDGVHNFTDGMALGSAFLLYGSVGGWSRTLFLLAHELPQEVGDFGILVRSGFSVSKALFFNFLSALLALVGTALGFTAGGFIYISAAGVLAEMNNNGSSTALKSTAVQVASLILGMSVALCISLVE